MTSATHSASEVTAASIAAWLEVWRMSCGHELDLREEGGILVCSQCDRPVVRRE